MRKLYLGSVDGDIPIIDVNPRNCEETKTAIEGDKLLLKMGFTTLMSNHYTLLSGLTPISKTHLAANTSMSKVQPK